jgi:hypothetical protein
MPQRRFAGPRSRFDDDDATPRARLVYALAMVALFAFGAIVWNMFGASAPPPRIAPDTAAYKVAAPSEMNSPDAGEASALDSVMQGEPLAEGEIAARPGPEAPLTQAQAPAATPAGALPAPRFAVSGPYVAQLAALQSEAAVRPAWDRLASRSPALFQSAQLDVERADLGQSGVYYRLRAGYFADREEAGRFCDRIKQMGQDCIAVRR